METLKALLGAGFCFSFHGMTLQYQVRGGFAVLWQAPVLQKVDAAGRPPASRLRMSQRCLIVFLDCWHLNLPEFFLMLPASSLLTTLPGH